MPQEFEGDLAGAVFWGADLRGATFRDVDLTGASISHARFVDMNVDALVKNVVINGVDVTAYVNERDPWYPLRTILEPETPAQMAATLAALDDAWAPTFALARSLPTEAALVSVDGEFSFVETLRHMVFAVDKWFTSPVLGLPFDPMGMPNRGSVDFPWPDLDNELTPSLDEASAVWADRVARLADFIASATPTDLERQVEILENGPHEAKGCLHVVFEESFWHNRYARRDLERTAQAI